MLEFILDTHPGSLMHCLGLLEFTVRICDAYTSQHIRDLLNLSHDCDLITVFTIGFPFALVFICTAFTECVTYHHEAHEEFWKISGYFLKCV